MTPKDKLEQIESDARSASRQYTQYGATCGTRDGEQGRVIGTGHLRATGGLERWPRVKTVGMFPPELLGALFGGFG